MALYESEYTLFLREMRTKHPQWEAEQSEGLSLLWDKNINLSEQEAFCQSSEPNRAYPYDVHFRKI